jgi:hypothetical protein
MLRMFVNTDAVTTDWSVGKEVLSAFAEADMRLIPETLHRWETRIGEFETVEQCEPDWAMMAQGRAHGSMHEFPIGLGWRRKKTVKYQAEIDHSQTNALGRWNGGKLSVYASPHKVVDWLPVFRRVCGAMMPTFGLLHYFTDIEDLNLKSGTPENDFSGGHDFGKGIPNIAWATFLGAKYAHEIRAEQIAESGFAIEKLGDGYLIRVTDNINDLAENFPYFSQRRAALKRLFRDDFFLVKNEPISR